MKYKIIILIGICSMFLPGSPVAQDKSVSPSLMITGEYLGESPPLRDLPVLTESDWRQMADEAEQEERNEELVFRDYPFANIALPKGSDPAWQDKMGANRDTRAPIQNYNGYDSPYYPPDPNGTIGQEYFMQTINLVYTIYNRAGTVVAGPGNLNTLFSGVTGSEYNNGDPIVLYDEQADRYLVAEFSVGGANDYMLIAVSTTNDPTGTWYRYSFDVADVPDYEKFGIWRDGYYMATNNSGGNDIYVFERSQMLSGGTAQGVGFDNPWRPTTFDGFMCVPPLDNDGTFAPAGEPGLFITINDDAIGGGSDQLWIYELAVDWATPANSTFSRSQQLDVAAFDSNFGSSWDNIQQLGTTMKLDAIPMVIMNPPQYRNFGTYETILCCHTVDVDNTDHAGIRWYELRRPTNGSWTIRQQGTYAPDAQSRWMGSIMLNGSNEIGLGYSVSSSTMYPGIRYCGQSASAYAAATGNLDISEEIIQAGEGSQTAYNRWGDYSSMQVDPLDDETFWYTSMYIGTTGIRKTKIASFQVGSVLLTANFFTANTNPQVNTTVNFTDMSFGGATSWNWSITPATYIFTGGTTASSQNPKIQFTAAGNYTINLTVSDGINNDTKTKTNYINAIVCNALTLPVTEDFSDGVMPGCWMIADNQGNGQVWRFNNPGGRTIATTTGANGFAILDSDRYGPGSSQNSDLITPVLNFSANSNVNLSFQHYFRNATGSSGTLSYSQDGGSSWTVIQTWTAETANPATFSLDVSAQVAGKANVRFKWNYTGTYGYYWIIDDLNITGTPPELWTGNTSTAWTNTGNWTSGIVPTSTTMVAIPSSAPNWPTFTGDFTLGINCKNLTLNGAAQMTVTGKMTIATDKTLAFTGNGQLNIGGNWTNCGTFVPGSGSLVFNSATAATSAGYTTTSGIANYTRSTFTKGMTALAGATTGPTGNNGGLNAAIGFAFNYIGTAYDSVHICTNGWISLNKGGGIATGNANLFNINIPNTSVAPWWDDLSDDATSVVSFKTEGNAPFRVFTTEWSRVLTFSVNATARISFQVKLYETTNIIEFHYGSLEAGTHNASESASIGIEDATGGSNHFIEATTGSMTTGVTNLVSTTNWPTVNYRFSPPTVAQTFNSISVDKSGSSLTFNTNTALNGNLTITNGTVLAPGNASNTLSIGGNLSNNGTFTPGSGTVILNGTSNQNIGGTSSITFNNLTLNNPSGITLQNNEKVSGTLTMTSGSVSCGSYTFELGTSTTTLGTLAWTSGNIAGSFKRWIAASTVTAIDFPVGTATSSNKARITFANNTAGSLTAKFEQGDPGGNSGFPLTEGGVTMYSNDQYTEGTWTLVPATLTSTNYALELTGTGFASAGTPSAAMRIIKRPDAGGAWILNGTHVAGSAPVAKRSGLSGFSRFAIAKPCDVAATVTPGGPDTVCRSSSPSPITLAGASAGGSATSAAWSITGINPANGGNNGTLSSTSLTGTPSSVTYTPPANYAGTVTLTLTSNDPPGSCTPASGTRNVVVSQLRQISGNITYYNQSNTPIASGISVKLYQNGSQVGSDYTVTSGSYLFTNLCPGTYEIRMASSNPTDGSVNTTDAAQVNYWGALPYQIEKVRFYAGDVTGSVFYINSTDALKIQSNFVNGTGFDKGPWAFWKAGETISSNSSPSESYASVTISTSDITANIYALCAGDFNLSFNPAANKSASSSLELVYTGNIQANSNEEFDLPVHLVNASGIGAVSLILNFPPDLVEIENVAMNGDDGHLEWAVRDGNELRIGWTSSVPLYFSAYDEILNVKMRTGPGFTAGKSIKITLAANPLNELADEKSEIIPDALISTVVIDAAAAGLYDPEAPDAINLACQPNPFSDITRISYSLPFEGSVNLDICSILGRKIVTLVSKKQASGNYTVKFDSAILPAGIYIARLEVNSDSRHFVRTIKLINNR